MATTTRKYLKAVCRTCGRKLRAESGSYVYSRFTGNYYCIPCCVNEPKRRRR